MPFECDVKVEQKDLRHYMFYHKYVRLSGVLEILIGLGCLIYGIMNYSRIDMDYQPFMILLVFFGLYFLLLSPMITLTNSAKQFMLNPTYKNTYHYKFDKKGMTISQADDSATLEWERFYKVVDNKKGIVIYISRYNANIIPKVCLGSRVDELKGILRKNLPDKKVKAL